MFFLKKPSLVRSSCSRPLFECFAAVVCHYFLLVTVAFQSVIFLSLNLYWPCFLHVLKISYRTIFFLFLNTIIMLSLVTYIYLSSFRQIFRSVFSCCCLFYIFSPIFVISYHLAFRVHRMIKVRSELRLLFKCMTF